jgi:hypothetical protein
VETRLLQLKTSRIHSTWSRNSNSTVRSTALLQANSSLHLSWLLKERKEDLQDQPHQSEEEKRTQVKEPKKCKKSWPTQVKYSLSNSLGTQIGQPSRKKVQIRSKFWKISTILTMLHLKLR